ADDECGRRGHGHRRRNHGRRRHGVRGGGVGPRGPSRLHHLHRRGRWRRRKPVRDTRRHQSRHRRRGHGQGPRLHRLTGPARDAPMLALAIIYVIVVLLVAGFRGLRALLGLGFAGAVLFVFMLPAMLEGKPPLLVAMVSASLIMVVALYLAHGVSTRTSTALF